MNLKKKFTKLGSGSRFELQCLYDYYYYNPSDSREGFSSPQKASTSLQVKDLFGSCFRPGFSLLLIWIRNPDCRNPDKRGSGSTTHKLGTFYKNDANAFSSSLLKDLVSARCPLPSYLSSFWVGRHLCRFHVWQIQRFLSTENYGYHM